MYMYLEMIVAENNNPLDNLPTLRSNTNLLTEYEQDWDISISVAYKYTVCSYLGSTISVFASTRRRPPTEHLF